MLLLLGHTSMPRAHVQIILQKLLIIRSEINRDRKRAVGMDAGSRKSGVFTAMSMFHPNIVLLMIGTNDILQNIDLGNAPERLASLVDEIIADAPNALLVVASIPPCCTDATVQTYNATIPDMVTSRAQAGKHILFVDAHAAFVKDTNYKADYISSDGLHPSSNGYAVIGDLFYGAIKTVLP